MGIFDSLEDVGGHSGSSVRMITDFRVLAIAIIIVILFVCALIYVISRGLI